MTQIILGGFILAFCLYLIEYLNDFFKQKWNRRKVQIKNNITTSLGLLCQSAKKCDGEGCKKGKKYSDFTCTNCIGISDESLWIKECKKCNNSRLEQKTFGKCKKCVGTGFLPYGSYIQVADTDFPEMMTRYDAKNTCGILGNGWRLPTQNELCGMYILHKKGKGDFKKCDDDGLWCCYYSIDYPWYFSFHDGEAFEHFRDRDSTGFVRAVRDLP